MSPIEFQLSKDLRGSDCKHPIWDGCYHCCTYCDHVAHRCGGCGEPASHQSETCDDCRKLYFTDEIVDEEFE